MIGHISDFKRKWRWESTLHIETDHMHVREFLLAGVIICLPLYAEMKLLQPSVLAIL